MPDKCPFAKNASKTGYKLRHGKVDVKDQPLIDICLECIIVPCKMDEKERVV